MLAGSICACPWYANQARAGGGIDDRPSRPLLEHLDDLVLQAQPDTFEIDGDSTIKISLAELYDRNAPGPDTGIVVGIIQLSIDLDCLANERLDLARLGDIGFDECRLPACLANQAYRLVAAFGNKVGDDYAGPFLGEFQSRDSL